MPLMPHFCIWWARRPGSLKFVKFQDTRWNSATLGGTPRGGKILPKFILRGKYIAVIRNPKSGYIEEM
jgi:hypothetical protein